MDEKKMTGHEALEFWRENDLLGTFADRPEDSPELARKLREEAQTRAESLRAWAESNPRDTPLLSDEATSREAIYSDDAEQREAHRQRVMEIAGKYRGLAPTVDEYLQEKHEDNVKENAAKPDTATLALLDEWSREAESLTPEERKEAEAEGDAFMRGMNANRALEGRPPVFPEIVSPEEWETKFRAWTDGI